MCVGAVYLYDEGISASPTEAPTEAPVATWFLETTYGPDVPGTGSNYGQSVDMYTSMIIVGSPTAEIGGVAMGKVSILDAYSTTTLYDVSTVCCLYAWLRFIAF